MLTDNDYFRYLDTVKATTEVGARNARDSLAALDIPASEEFMNAMSTLAYNTLSIMSSTLGYKRTFAFVIYQAFMVGYLAGREHADRV